MKRTILSIALLAAGLRAQTQVSLQAPAPTNVSNVAVTGGAAGSSTFYYWVIAVYPVGKVLPNGPAIAIAKAAPTAGVPLAVSWTPVSGATSYDILKTTTPATPTGTCTCALATAQTGSTVNDTGASLTSYTVASTAGPASAVMVLDNRTGAAPFVTVTIQSVSGTSVYKLAVVSPATVAGQCQIVGTDGVIVSSAYCVFNNQANTYTGGGLQDLSAMKLAPPRSTVAGLPAAAAGNANQVYLVTDGVNSGDCTVGGSNVRSLCVSTGSAWQTLGSSGGAPNIATIVRPVPASFAWVNQGTATLTTTGGGLNISGPGTAGTQVRAQVATPGTPTFSCTMNISTVQALGNARAGVLMRESGTGKLLSFASGGATVGALLVDRWASVTSFTGTQLTYSMAGPFFPNGWWVRATYDGTNAKWLISPDGVTFVEIYTEVATGSFTAAPDQCGIFYDSEGASDPPQSVSLLSYAN